MYVARNKYKKNSTAIQLGFFTSFRDWFIRNWITLGLIITAIIIVAPWLKIYLRKMKYTDDEIRQEEEKDKEFRDNRNPVTQKVKVDNSLDKYPDELFIYHSKDQVHNAAKRLAHALGTLYSDTDKWYDWADPRGWTENDKDAMEILREYRFEYEMLIDAYYIVTRSRDLSQDIIKYLDEDVFETLKTKYGYNTIF